MRIILASASPRRRELLAQAGLTFDVMPSTVEEEMRGSTPEEIVLSLAQQKAEDVFENVRREYIEKDKKSESWLVIGADTIVVCDGVRLGKPKDDEDARRMLKMLSGRAHEVYTGVCLIVKDRDRVKRQGFAECTRVHMYPISDAQAEWYVSTKEPADKAGAYGIQGKGAVFIKGIEGDYNNVVGLPLARVWQSIIQLRGESSNDNRAQTIK